MTDGSASIPEPSSDNLEPELCAGHLTPMAHHPLMLPTTEAPYRWVKNGYGEPILTAAMRANTSIPLEQVTDFKLLLKRGLISCGTTVRPMSSKITGVVIHNKALGFIAIPTKIGFEISQTDFSGLVNENISLRFEAGITNTHGHTPNVLAKLWTAGILPVIHLNVAARLDPHRMTFQCTGGQMGDVDFMHHTCRTRFTKEEIKSLRNIHSGFAKLFTDFQVVGAYVDLDVQF